MTLLLGFLIAAAVGLTGVGAGTLTAPLLILVFHQSPAMAVGTALVFTMVIKVVVAPVYMKRRQVNLRGEQPIHAKARGDAGDQFYSRPARHTRGPRRAAPV